MWNRLVKKIPLLLKETAIIMCRRPMGPLHIHAVMKQFKSLVTL